jgi:hypothetical protein
MPQSTWLDLTGERFGMFTVLREAPRRGPRRVWLCLCDCGAEVEVFQVSLRAGKSQGCGCRRRSSKRRKVHGRSKTAEYGIWRKMLERCHNPNDAAYPNYGGRGITICAQWRESFVRFYHDVGPRPSPRPSLDRIDNDGNYEPRNVRWATSKEQTRNRRGNVYVTHAGITQTVADWALVADLPYSTLRTRIRLGWPMERALTAPVKGKTKP